MPLTLDEIHATLLGESRSLSSGEGFNLLGAMPSIGNMLQQNPPLAYSRLGSTLPKKGGWHQRHHLQ